ncbi:MAG: oligosaccharide flippase family protein [Clostridia bacterium]|nr:oligosaccharide flippase family protein [Clostridia bacterium]
MKKTIFIKNAIILSATGLLLRFIGVIFKVWLASIIGSEGIGLYQIVFSVYVFASTFATSGISTAVTRLCADEISRKNKYGVKSVLKKSVFVTLSVAIISVCIIFFGATVISKNIIGDIRATLSLKVLSFSLPFMGLCSCFRGYFIARRKATSPAVSQIIEQIVRIIIVFFAVKTTVDKGLDICCAGVFLGDTISEAVSCFILYIVYKFDMLKHQTQNTKIKITYNIYKKIGEIAIPITGGRYLNSALRTAENILVPKFLGFYKKAKTTALSQFGMIKGMALPLIFFPSTMLNAMSTLLIPELSEANSKGQKFVVSGIVSRCMSITALISYLFSAVFFIAGKEIGILVYKSETVGNLIKLLSPLVPLMYLDSICDGMLKGLDQQKFTFFTSVSDSSIRIIAVIFLLPKFGLMGFIGIMYFSNAFTGFLNIGRLISVANATFSLNKAVLIPLMSAFLSVLIADLLVKRLFYPPILVYIMLVVLLSMGLYLLILSKTTDYRIRDFL